MPFFINGDNFFRKIHRLLASGTQTTLSNEIAVHSDWWSWSLMMMKMMTINFFSPQNSLKFTNQSLINDETRDGEGQNKFFHRKNSRVEKKVHQRLIANANVDYRLNFFQIHQFRLSIEFFFSKAVLKINWGIT